MAQLVLFDTAGDIIVEIHNRLWTAYHRELRTWDRPEPIDMLGLAMLSQRTSHEDAWTAYMNLLNAYRDWSGVAAAPTLDIQRRIRMTTRPEQKAPRLQSALLAIEYLRGGRIDLDNLSRLSTDDALHWLEQLYGVRRKTSSAVLLFSTTHRRTLPVDTGHRRLMMRLNVLPYRIGWDEAHACVDELLPPTWDANDFELHHDLAKIHNQTRCTSAAPRCADCPLLDLCSYAKARSRGVRIADVRQRRPHKRRRRQVGSQTLLPLW